VIRKILDAMRARLGAVAPPQLISSFSPGDHAFAARLRRSAVRIALSRFNGRPR
jgi:hypothetical protein